MVHCLLSLLVSFVVNVMYLARVLLNLFENSWGVLWLRQQQKCMPPSSSTFLFTRSVRVSTAIILNIFLINSVLLWSHSVPMIVSDSFNYSSSSRFWAASSHSMYVIFPFCWIFLESVCHSVHCLSTLWPTFGVTFSIWSCSCNWLQMKTVLCKFSNSMMRIRAWPHNFWFHRRHRVNYAGCGVDDGLISVTVFHLHYC